MEHHEIIPGAGAGAGMVILTLPVTGVGPIATASVLANTLLISGLVALGFVCLVIGLRVLMRARV
jgi:hypothetical protein